MTTRPRPSSRARGDCSTAAHKAERRRRLADLARRPGQPCSRCGRPMFIGQALDLDHTDDRRGYRGLAHRSCNRRDGQRKTTQVLKAKGWTPSRQSRQAMAYRQRAAARWW